MSPITVPRTRSGTISADTKPTVRSSASPVRITLGEPAGASGSSGYRRSYSSTNSRFVGSACSMTTRSMLPSGRSSSTKHQSAYAGTVRRAIVASVSSKSSERAS
jgi:hypothetical protein